MSSQLAFDTICLKPTGRLAHTEYSLAYHPEYVRQVTGLEAGTHEATLKLYDAWSIDFNWSVNDGLHGNWGERGRATDMGHAVYAGDGSDQRQPAKCPFTEPEEVWEFDAVEEYGLADFQAQVDAYEQSIQTARANFPDQFTTGGYYKTIVSGAIQAFGWDMLLLAMADQDKTEAVLDSFARRTAWHMRAWAETSAEVIIQHDDFVWTAGPFVHPDFYRRVIIPRYAEMWKPLKAAGKKILFCSDGLFTMFAKDIVEAGADGLIFEPCNDFEFMAENFGQTSCLVGSAVDCRDLTFAPWETVQASIDKTLKLAERCKGLIWACGNHLPANISNAMMQRYIDYLLPRLDR